MYSGAWLISLRPYLTVRREESALSGVLSVRYHFGGETEYLFGRVGTGFSADERFIQTNEGFVGKDLFFLESQFLGIGAQMPLSASVDARVGADYTRRELGFLSGEFVSMFTATAGISYHW
jgi:YaiO family outer membrane protein